MTLDKNSLDGKARKKLKLSEKQIKIVRIVVFVFAFLSYIDLLFTVTLYKRFMSIDPATQETVFTHGINFIPFTDWTVTDFILNAFAFFPFGFLLQMTSKDNKVRAYPVLIPLLVSVLIETVQYAFSVGVADTTDVISNITGAFIGCLLYLLFNLIFRKHRQTANNVLLCLIGIAGVVVFISGL